MKAKKLAIILDLLIDIWYNSNMKNKYDTNNTWKYSCKYHIIWCPKYRRKVLINGIDDRIKELLKEWQDELDYKIIEQEIMPDYIHLLIYTTSDVNMPDLVKTFKGRTARILRNEFPELKKRLPNLWTRSKFIATVGSVSLEIVKKYIEEQKNV